MTRTATVQWICKNYSLPGGRHAGAAATLPTRCPYCGHGVEVRTHCACGHPMDDCCQSICSHRFARDD